MSEYKKEGKTLVDVLENIYSEIGYYKSNQIQLNLEEKNSKNKMDNILNLFRNKDIGDKIINDIKITDK